MPFISTGLIQSLRALRRTPWYSLAIVGVVALSLGLAATTFAVVDGVLFKPLPYPDADALYRVSVTSAGSELRPGQGAPVSHGDVRDFETAAPNVRFALYRGGTGGGDAAGDLRSWIPVAAEVDERFFDVLGVRPFIGGFAPWDFDMVPGSAIPALIGYGLWQARFNGRADVIGEVLQELTGDSGPMIRWRVAGVLPREFLFPTGTPNVNLLTPLIVLPGNADMRLYSAIARMPSGSDAGQIADRLSAVARERPTGRGTGAGPAEARAVLSPLNTSLGGAQRPMFARIFATVAVLVLLACVNISSLTASRGIDRQRELSLRRALGASAGQLASMMLRENAILFSAGTFVGLAVSPLLLATIVPLIFTELALLKAPELDARVIVFAMLAMAVTGVLASIWPLASSLRQRPVCLIASGGASATPARSRSRLAIVGLQIALGLMLTLGGGLMLGSLVSVWQTDVGFPAEGLLIVGVETPRDLAPQAREEEIARYLAAVRRLPGVTAAGVTRSATILRRTVSTGPFPDADTYPVSPGFFEALGATLVDGRLPSDDELERKAPVVVVSSEVARQYFDDGRAVGREIVPTDGSQPVTVIGIVGETRLNGWDFTGQGGEVYTAFSGTSPAFSVFIRTRPDARGVAGDVLRVTAEPERTILARRAAWADELLGDSIKTRRLWAWVFGLSAAAALAIVGAGVLGLISMATARRTREMGIRMAIGATPSRIATLVIHEQIIPVAAGLAVGGLGSAWTMGLLRNSVYGTLSVYDARVWAVAVAVVVLTAGLGAVIPALRASRADPARTLRAD